MLKYLVHSDDGVLFSLEGGKPSSPQKTSIVESTKIIESKLRGAGAREVQKGQKGDTCSFYAFKRVVDQNEAANVDESTRKLLSKQRKKRTEISIVGELERAFVTILIESEEQDSAQNKTRSLKTMSHKNWRVTITDCITGPVEEKQS